MVKFIVSLLSVILLFFNSTHSVALADQKPLPAQVVKPADKSPVILGDQVLFYVRGIKYLTSERRALGISERLKNLAEDLTVSTDSILSLDTDVSTDIVSGDSVIMAVLDQDALPEGTTRQRMAQQYAADIRTAIEKYREDYSRKSVLSGAIYSLLATALFFAVFFLLLKLFRKLNSLMDTRYKTKIHGISIKSAQIVQPQRVITMIKATINFARDLIWVILLYVYLHLVLSFFPWTRPFASHLLGYLLVPVNIISRALIVNIPNLIFIAVLAFITRYILKFTHMLFQHVEQGSVSLPGFYPEWAKPTNQLLTFAVIVFAAIVAFPYIPGSESPAFKGISIFIGVLFSLGSKSLMSNTVAGMVMTYRRAFRLGDRIRVGEVTGDVIEIRHQVTFIRTVKNEKVIMPNSMLLNSPIINYSSLVREQGLILHTTVTIGYDAPWRQVHELLLMAAHRTEGLLMEPPPFILQTSLDDYYVRYELNVYTDAPQHMAELYSGLHRNIQDCFNEYGVQIMSPHYLGDPADVKIVPKDKWYAPPAKPPQSEDFNVS